jgi:hypothetical protein
MGLLQVEGFARRHQETSVVDGVGAIGFRRHASAKDIGVLRLMPLNKRMRAAV